MKVKSEKDLFAGLMFVVLGIAFVLGSRSYTLGTGAKMGPGYFPTILGVVLTLIGIGVTLIGVTSGPSDGDKIGKFAWKPLFFIITANLAFGASIGGIPSINLPPFGLVFGIYLLTFISAKAGDEFDFKEVAVLSTVLAVMSYLAFIVLLKLQFPVWPTFITG